MHARTLATRLALNLLLTLAWAATLVGCGGRAQGDGHDAAAHFLQELREGHLEPAWQGTTAEFKSLMGLESLRDCVKFHPGLKAPAEYIAARDATRDGRSMVEHSFKIESRARGKTVNATAKVLMAAPNGSWAVEHLSVE